MNPHGIKSCLKSLSLGNLSMLDDNKNEVSNARVSAGTLSRSDKHNLCPTDEQIRDLSLKLKEFSSPVLSNKFYYSNDFEIDFPFDFPDNNLKKLQVNSDKYIYQQQSAIWELLVTEQNFLKQIQFIVQVYVIGFEILRQEYFPNISCEDIFSNLKDVSRVSLDFWKECMRPVIDHFETTKETFKPRYFKTGFIKIGSTLEPYIQYCTEISKCRLLILSLEKSNELFAEYMKWAINLEESNREILCDHLAKPFQRLTKYKILLLSIQKYSNNDEKSEIQEMIDSVDSFVCLVNKKIEETSLIKTLFHLNSLIDTYDVIESLGDDLIPIINQYSKLDLTSPIQVGNEKIIRNLIYQGSVKMREGSSKIMDIKLFLFTDILLITKYKKKAVGKLKIIKPPIMLETLNIKRSSNNSFICLSLNKFNCISALYHFSNGNQKKIDEWIQMIDETLIFYLKLKSTQLCNSFYANIPESIPTFLKILRSSPKQENGKFKPHSNSECLDNDLGTEFNLKRKAHVTKKHKNKKEVSILKIKSNSSSNHQRKISNPTVKGPSLFSVEKHTKLFKSNSLEIENEKTQFLKHSHECSDIDEPITKTETYFHENKELENYKTNNQFVQSDTGNCKTKTVKKLLPQLSSTLDDHLNRKLSISLNILNI